MDAEQIRREMKRRREAIDERVEVLAGRTKVLTRSASRKPLIATALGVGAFFAMWRQRSRRRRLA